MTDKKRSVRTMSQRELTALRDRMVELAAAGQTKKGAAKILAAEYPGYAITFNTIRSASEHHGIKFSGHRAPKEALTTLSREELGVLVEKERRIQALEQELRDTKMRYKMALTQETLAERLIETALPQIQALPAVVPGIFELEVRDSSTPQDAVCLNSCLHNGEVVERDETMGIGEYNPRLAAARYEYYMDTVLDLTFNHHRGENIEHLWIVNVGDNASGAIHDELKASNAFPLGEQLVRTAYLLAAGVRDAAHQFKKVTFIGTVGNHLRFERRPAFKDKVHNNGDWVIYHLVRALLADQVNVEVVIPESPFVTQNIRGHEFFFTHGDNIKSYFQFPWYDAKRFANEMGQLLVSKGEPYPEYWGFGHFHQINMSQLSYGEWLFTGSFAGPNEYSIGKLRAGTAPNQLLFGVHERRGVSFRYPVVLTDADPDVQNRYAELTA